MKAKPKNKILKWLCWVTNNQEKSLHEMEFDIWFFIVNTICLVIGIAFFIMNKEYPWIAVLVIEYNWALDNLRNNRDYLK